MATFADGCHANTLLQTLERFRSSGLMCDVLLQTKSHILPAHRLVLAAFSPYFKTMFNSQLKESYQECIIMKDFDPVALEAMVSFAYTSNIQITESNALQLFLISNFLQVTSVQDASSRCICNNLHPSNCLGIYKMADMHSYSDLAQAAFSYAQTHFDQVIEAEEFLAISLSELSILISSPQLGLANEDNVLRSVLTWVRHDLALRAPFTFQLLRHVHLDQLCPNHLRHQLENQAWLQSLAVDSFDQLWEAYRTLIGQQNLDSGPVCLPKKRLALFNKPMVILSVGGESQGIILDSMHCYHLDQDKWTTGGALNYNHSNIKPMKIPRVFCSAVSDATSIYVIGGMQSIESIASVERYDIYTNEWTDLESSMNTPRHGASASFLGVKLYVIGGRDNRSYLNSAEVYDPAMGCWMDIEPMGERRAFLASAVICGMLYAIGGSGGVPEDSANDFLKSVERYDPARGWTPVAPMREARAYFVATTVNDCIYALGGYRGGDSWTASVERYQPATNCWSYLAPLLSPRSSFGAAACQGFIFVAGGFIGTKNVNTVERYNPATDEWVMVSAMPVRRYGMALVATTT